MLTGTFLGMYLQVQIGGDMSCNTVSYLQKETVAYVTQQKPIMMKGFAMDFKYDDLISNVKHIEECVVLIIQLGGKPNDAKLTLTREFYGR
jgi:hypothetical protein